MRSGRGRVGSDEVVHGETEAGQREAVPTPLQTIQRYAGNRAVTALLTGSGQGEALDPAVRADMQSKLGASFADVRVHRGPVAAEAAASVDAQAFTAGRDVVFGAGAYDPGSPRGQQTIAHELTHVTQQRNGPVAGGVQRKGLGADAPGDQLEREADAVANQVVRSPAATPRPTNHSRAPASDLTAPAEPFMLGGLQIASYSDAAVAVRYWAAQLQEASDELAKAGLGVPADLAAVVASGQADVEVWAGGGAEPFDRGNATDLRAWYDRYTRAYNDVHDAEAAEAARRVRATADRMREAEAALQAAEPVLRERQRSAFRSGDEDALLQTADNLATVLDTLLTTKDTIEKTLEFADSLRHYGGVGVASTADVTAKVSRALEIAEKVNKWYATFQLARASLDLISGGKTDSAGGHAAASAMATVMSAGGTLLGASAGFTLYSNLYIGPMVSACLSSIKRLEDTLSKSENRAYIQLGKLDWVNWTIEPGGRAMFDYMLEVMHASSAAETPLPRGKVNDYLVDNEDDFEAGAIGSDEMPMSGHWFWRDTDDASIRQWLFRHRKDMWGMLYGDCPVPR